MAPTIRTVDLVKSWLGQTLRATGAAVVIPVAILAAVALTAFGGAGLGGLGSLSEIVAGPRAAGSEVNVDDGGEEIGDAVTQLAAADTGVTGDSGAGTTPDAPGSGDGGGGPSPPPGTGPGDPGAPPGGPPPPPDDDGGGNTPQPPAPPSPPPAPEPGLVGGVGEGIRDATEGTPVAPTVEDAVDTLAETCEQVGCP